ncbi:hypothetical protein [Pseudomonas sp.]|uniref:hypothetical protein n=1 Tax=Pseudomonas sp. TaxID=306 RepID=UPI0028A21693|nr:hypothetical protein [Pseudomonas sp.]
MKFNVVGGAFVLFVCMTASAGSYEWTSGWGMGVSELSVDDGNSNSLLISCPDDSESGYVSASATINGKEYSSESETGFDVVVDGKSYSNPFYTDCRACGSIFTHEFWPALRKANRLQLVAEGTTINLPTKNINKVLKPYNSKENSCQSAW